MNTPVIFYVLIGKKDYVLENPLSADDIINIFESNDLDEKGHLVNENYIGLFKNKYYAGINWGVLNTEFESGEEYIIATIGINKSKEVSEVSITEFIAK